MREWNRVTLDALGMVSRGKSKHRPRNDPQLFGGKYPFIQTADVASAPFYITEYTETYNERGLSQSKLWEAGTLCITIAANIADTAILGIDACFPDSIMGFVPYAGVSDVRFVKYAFDMLKTDMRNISQGTAQDNLSWQKLSSIRFPAPPYMIQKRIADYLCAYEDLIETNQRQIKLLEEAAQRLYKEWFVDLRYPGHENVPMMDGVPEGWSSIYLGEAISYEIGGGWGEEYITANNVHEAYVIRGTDFDGLKYGEFLNIPLRFHTESNLSARKLQHGDIIFEVSGGSRTEGVARTVRIIDSMLNKWKKPVMCASFCKLIRPLNDEISQYLFDHLRYLRAEKITEEFDKRSASSIVNYRWKDFLNQRTLLYPDKSMLRKYNSIAVPLYEKIMTLSLQIGSAKVTRDRLLPKLMSGEIAV